MAIMVALITVFIFYTKTRGAWLSIFIELVLILVFLIAQRRRLAHWFFGNKSKRNASIFVVALCLFTD
ncbi:MAG: hypothetical protein Rsou_1610 [Candidatus Ruthia sp. Asou_11_S2]|nr:hypothetical protein [Candidatus Ruthia sp. Asou_11_S2]